MHSWFERNRHDRHIGIIALFVIAPVVQLQAQNDSGASVPAHSTVAPAKGRWNDLLAKWRQNKPKLKACRVEARKKGLAGDDRWFLPRELYGQIVRAFLRRAVFFAGAGLPTDALHHSVSKHGLVVRCERRLRRVSCSAIRCRPAILNKRV